MGARGIEVAEFLRIASTISVDPRALIDEILRAAPSLGVRMRRRQTK